MEELAIQSKFENNSIDSAFSQRVTVTHKFKKVVRYVVYFMDGEHAIPLEIQRGGIRQFSSLNAAANLIKNVGLKEFRVFL